MDEIMEIVSEPDHLLMQTKELHAQISELNKTSEFYKKQADKYMMESIKYRNAFQAIMEELRK